MSMQSDGGGDDDLLLPPELWRGILSRLPVKSILRFRSVSKSWYSLISCPDFASDYSISNPNKNGNRVLIQHFEPTNGASMFSSHDESFMESYDFGVDVFGFRYVKIIGSCNGLICLSNNPDNGVQHADFLLWNPAVRKVVELPCRSSPLGGHCFTYFGFGFDPKSRDYKVLCGVEDDESSSLRNYVSVCEIYDLSKGVWRGIDPLVTSCRSNRKQQCYLNGAVHWISHNYSVKKSIILSFDMSDEIWREMNVPDGAEFTRDHDDQHLFTRCGTFDGLIYLIRWKKDYMEEICSVWVMKEYGVAESWTKLFNVDMQSSQAFSGADRRQFRLWKNGELLVVHYQEVELNDDGFFVGEQELSLYNGESKICKRIFSYTKMFMNMCLYEESLGLM